MAFVDSERNLVLVILLKVGHENVVEVRDSAFLVSEDDAISEVDALLVSTRLTHLELLVE